MATNVQMIRGGKEKAPRVADAANDLEPDTGRVKVPHVARREPYVTAEDFRRRDELADLVSRWRAPVLDDDVIEVLAVAYRMTPRTSCSFLEWLVAKGFGEVSR